MINRKGIGLGFLIVAMGVVTLAPVPALKSVSASQRPVTYAEYVSEDFAPVIDGEVDEIWYDDAIGVIEVNKTTDSNATPEFSCDIIMLWNESGLYFLAEVTDSTTNNSDRCNFWVSESYVEEIPQAPAWYADVDGAYYLCLNPKGENIYYVADPNRDIDMAGKYEVATKKTDSGYLIELYVPRTGTTVFRLGNSVGFECSIDDYLAEEQERYCYKYWNGEYYYWEYPYGLGEVVLSDFNKTDGSPVTTPTDNEGNTDDNTNNHEGDFVEEPTEEKGVDFGKMKEMVGCSSTLSTMPVVAITFGGTMFAFFKKKKK